MSCLSYRKDYFGKLQQGALGIDVANIEKILGTNFRKAVSLKHAILR
jgi:hypothetical protein